MKKIKVLALVMVFAFAALGGAYAMWSDNVNVNDDIYTGTVAVEWWNDCMSSSDPGPNYTGYTGKNGHTFDVYGTDTSGEGLDSMDPGNPNDNKNVGYKDFSIDTSNSKLLNIEIKNGYPGYQEYVIGCIKNTGTVPVKLEGLTIKGPNGADYNPETAPVLIEVTREDDSALLSPEKPQIDPQDCFKIKINERVKQIADQNKKYNYTIEIKAVQWNESGFTLPNNFVNNNRKLSNSNS